LGGEEGGEKVVTTVIKRVRTKGRKERYYFTGGSDPCSRLFPYVKEGERKGSIYVIPSFGGHGERKETETFTTIIYFMGAVPP